MSLCEVGKVFISNPSLPIRNPEPQKEEPHLLQCHYYVEQIHPSLRSRLLYMSQ